MGLDKPQDFAWMFVIIAGVVLTFGLGVSSVSELQGETSNTTYFSSITGKINSTTGLSGAAADQSESLSGSTQSGEQTSEDAWYTRAFNSLLSLGKTWSIVEDSFETTEREFGLNSLYWVLISSALLITFAAIMYSWLRGK